MIESIPNVSIPSVGLPILSLDFSNGGAQSPSSLTVVFIDEDGIYPSENSLKSLLTVESTVKIDIGDFIFIGHPIRYDIQNSDSGKILTLKYVDSSILLDNYFVGLTNVHLNASTGNIIIIGDEFQEYEDINIDSYDLCNPCEPVIPGSEASEKELLEMANRKIQTSILQVKYTFDDLLSNLPVPYSFIGEKPRVNPEEKYKNSYTGTLREVLSSWCSDYGLTFFWDNGKIVFINVKNGVKIDTSSISDKRIISNSYGYSLENSVSKGISLGFQKEGQEADYSCSEGLTRRLAAFPIRLSDIISDKSNIFQSYKTYERMEAMCIMSMYSKPLRDNYVYWIKEGITTPEIANTKRDQNIRLLGSLVIKQVLWAKSALAVEKAAYNKLIGDMPEEERLDFVKNRGYFIIAENTEGLLEKYQEFEANLGSDFLGKYFFKRFDTPFNENEMSVTCPDPHNYYKTKSTTIFPFADLVPDSILKASELFQQTFDSNNGKVKNNFILIERNISWLPSSAQSPEVEKLTTDMDKLGMKDMGVQTIFGLVGQGQKIFKCYSKPSSFSVSSFTSGEHPIESENVKIPVEAYGYKTVYGLRSARCCAFQIKSKSNPKGINIYSPPQALSCTNNAGYIFIIHFDKSSQIKSLYPKNQTSLAFNTSAKGIRYDFQYLDMTEKVERYLTKLVQNGKIEPGNIAPISTCKISEELVKQVMAKLATDLYWGVEEGTEEKSYVLAGLPPSVSFYNGLDSLSVRITNQGVETNLSFSGKNFIPLSQNLWEKKFQELISKINGKKEIIRRTLPNLGNQVGSDGL